MDLPAQFICSYSFCDVESSKDFPCWAPIETINGIQGWIWCKKINGPDWECCLSGLSILPPSLGRKIEYKIRTNNGVETVGTTDGTIRDDTTIFFRENPSYFVNGNMTIECHVELYEVDKIGIRKPRTVIENKTEIGFRDQESLLAVEEKELQTAIALSNKEFEQAMAKQQKKAKEEQKKKETFSCTICLLEYGEEGDRTPRVLDCGHTLCLGCCKQIVQSNQIQCPFCRVDTQLTGRTISNLPKNYLALSL